MSEIWFVSDTHFGHKNIIKYCDRPFADVEEMDQALVDNWNKLVAATDTVWHLGDFAFHNHHRIGELNGFIHLVPGNHDHERMPRLQPYVGRIYEEVVYLKVSPTRRFVLCHYPFEVWRREYPYHLHGHTHGSLQTQVRGRLDVGVDATKLYAPIHIDEVILKLEAVA